jgi:hypothetical protein
MNVGAHLAVSIKIRRQIALPSANAPGLFAYFCLMVPTFGLALEKSRSQESEALRSVTGMVII